jgi:hypothetical protein
MPVILSVAKDLHGCPHDKARVSHSDGVEILRFAQDDGPRGGGTGRGQFPRVARDRPCGRDEGSHELQSA